jgi:hypothetical protein
METIEKDRMPFFLLESSSAMNTHKNTPVQLERRKHSRVAVQATGYLSRVPSDEIVPVVILNICIGGFQCRSRERFLTGESVSCVIALLGEGANENGRLHLLCRARVLRVENSEDSHRFVQLSCQIEEYHVHSGGVVPGLSESQGSGINEA